MSGERPEASAESCAGAAAAVVSVAVAAAGESEAEAETTTVPPADEAWWPRSATSAKIAAPV